jgi:hypothetical protein
MPGGLSCHAQECKDFVFRCRHNTQRLASHALYHAYLGSKRSPLQWRKLLKGLIKVSYLIEHGLHVKP